MTVLVRATEPGDIAAIREILSTEAVYRQGGQLPHRPQSYWDNHFKDRDQNGLEIVAEIDGQVVGYLSVVTSSKARTRHSATFGISVHADYHGRGAGKALMAEMVRHCDNYLNIVRLELVCHTDNLAAIALYEKFGFEREGLARFDIFTEGRYRHGLRMARINPNYLSMLSDEGA